MSKQQNDQRPGSVGGGALVALSILLALVSSCTFDPEGTGARRTSRVRASENGSAERSPEDSAEAARIAADRLRTGAQKAGSDAGARTSGADGAAGHTEPSAEEHERATQAATTVRAGASAVDPAAEGGGTAGVPSAAATAAADPPAADGGMAREDDAGDDSDAGTAPMVGLNAGNGGAGGSGNSMGRGGSGGRERAEAAGGASGDAVPDRTLLLSLLEIAVGVAQAHPTSEPGELLETLAAAESAAPGLLAGTLGYVARAEDCERDRTDACARVCDLVEDRCAACTADLDCRAALGTTCGSSATECR